MASFGVKVYVVQRPDGTVLAVKLTQASAQSIAKRQAPCRVLPMWADKSVIHQDQQPKE